MIRPRKRDDWPFGATGRQYTFHGMERVQVFFEGSVQGVGFRYRTQRIVERTQLAGSVRNLTDGRVELILQGPRPMVEETLREIRADLGEQIHREQAAWGPPETSLQGFRILPTRADRQ